MEGKELYDENDNLDQNKDNSESDDFGLPEIDDQDSNIDTEETTEEAPYSYEDTYGTEEPEADTESEPYSYESDYADTSEESESYEYESPSDVASDNDYGYTEDPYAEEEAEDDIPEYHDYISEQESIRRKSPAGVIVAIIIAVFVIVAGIAGYLYFFNEKPKETKLEPKVIQPVDTLPKVVEPEPEPIPEPAPAGTITELSTSTGRYYVIVASFVDDDLAMDYAKKLKNNGLSSTILAPNGQKKFYRLALADFSGWNDANLKAESLKGEYGQDVWVMRY